MKTAVISRSPDVMGGTPVFAGTRVPVQTLLDYLEAGESIDDFLAGFPMVSRETVISFLESMPNRLAFDLFYACGNQCGSGLEAGDLDGEAGEQRRPEHITHAVDGGRTVAVLSDGALLNRPPKRVHNPVVWDA